MSKYVFDIFFFFPINYHIYENIALFLTSFNEYLFFIRTHQISAFGRGRESRKFRTIVRVKRKGQETGKYYYSVQETRTQGDTGITIHGNHPD